MGCWLAPASWLLSSGSWGEKKQLHELINEGKSFLIYSMKGETTWGARFTVELRDSH